VFGFPIEMLRPVLIVGVLLGTMSIVDTLAYGVRTSGVLTRKLAISLSLFNILVIVSRFSNMLSAPILGNFPDKVYQGLYSVTDVRAALRVDLIFVIGGVIVGGLLMPTLIKFFQRGIQILEAVGTLPKTVAYGLRHLGELPRMFAAPRLRHLLQYSDFRVLPYQFLIYNIFVTCFYSIGVMSTVLAASVDHSVAGTAILLSGIVNGIATMTLFVIVDPPAAVVVENCISGTRPVSHAKIMNVSLVTTRLLGCLLALVLLPWMADYVLNAAHWVDRTFGADRSVLVGQASAQCNGLDYEFRLVRQVDAQYHFVLRVHNNSDSTQTLSYASGATDEFSVIAPQGALWQSSTGQKSTPALQEVQFKPHQQLTFNGAWDGSVPGLASPVKTQVTVIARHLLIPEPVTLQFSATVNLRPPPEEKGAVPGGQQNGG
jgi:hypothetical protein